MSTWQEDKIEELMDSCLLSDEEMLLYQSQADKAPPDVVAVDFGEGERRRERARERERGRGREGEGEGEGEGEREGGRGRGRGRGREGQGRRAGLVLVASRR